MGGKDSEKIGVKSAEFGKKGVRSEDSVQTSEGASVAPNSLLRTGGFIE